MQANVRLVVCVNDRIGQQSCVGSGNLEYIREIKAMLEEEGLGDIPVVERECLGKCEQGPVMRIAPGGKIFTKIKSSTLAQIIAELKIVLAASPTRY